MKAIVKRHPEWGVSIDNDYPETGSPAQGHIKVRVEAGAICGTDRGIYEYTEAAQAFNLRLPVVMGHEGAGTVVEVGEGVVELSVGDRVAFDSHVACGACYQCRIGAAHLCLNMELLGLHIDGLFAEFCTLPAIAAFKVPAAVSIEDAAMLEPAGVAMHALQAAREPLLGQRVLITGGGPVGLFIAELARIAGAARIVVVEPNSFRMGLAEEVGAVAIPPSEAVVGQVRAMSMDRQGFDIGFEASGHPSSFKTLSNSLRVGGTFVSVGFGSSGGDFDGAEYLNRRNITYVGSFGRRLWSTWDLLSVLISEGKLELSRFVTHRFPLAQFDEAVEVLSGDSCKVLVLPQG